MVGSGATSLDHTVSTLVNFLVYHWKVRDASLVAILLLLEPLPPPLETGRSNTFHFLVGQDETTLVIIVQIARSGRTVSPRVSTLQGIRRGAGES